MKLSDLIEFFENYDFNGKTLKLDQCTTIINQKKFVESHISYLKSNKGKKLFMPYYNRLLKLHLKLK